MARTLLLSTNDRSWRDWVKANRKGRDLICLDPTEPDQSPPGRLCLFRDDKVVAWRFYGSLDPQRSPQILLTALIELLEKAAEGVVVQLWPNRGTPLIRHVTMLAAQLAKPDQILVPHDAAMDQAGFPVGPEEVEIETAFPAMVQNAQRKAHWMKMFEACETHEFDLAKVSVEGARLGSGVAIHPDDLTRFFTGKAIHGEVAGGALFIVAREDPEDSEMARALDHFHCTRAHIAHQDDYQGVLCSFAKATGEDFGIGTIERIDFERGKVLANCTAVAPAPVRILRLGALKVDTAGRELGEVRPWQI
jgi:polynucleotide 5'-kinase involved in rRNA processing